MIGENDARQLDSTNNMASLPMIELFHILSSVQSQVRHPPVSLFFYGSGWLNPHGQRRQGAVAGGRFHLGPRRDQLLGHRRTALAGGPMQRRDASWEVPGVRSRCHFLWKRTESMGNPRKWSFE